MKALRGATNFTEDSASQIEERTTQLFNELMTANKLEVTDMVCVVFSLTKDIRSAYPAATFRKNFSDKVPLFSCVEPDIQGSLPLTLRVMILHEGDNNTPVYLYETKNLRKDLFYEHSN